MGFWKTLSSWLDHPYAAMYMCANCGSRVADPDSPCSECGDELNPDTPPEIVVDYWQFM